MLIQNTPWMMMDANSNWWGGGLSWRDVTSEVRLGYTSNDHSGAPAWFDAPDGLVCRLAAMSDNKYLMVVSGYFHLPFTWQMTLLSVYLTTPSSLGDYPESMLKSGIAVYPVRRNGWTGSNFIPPTCAVIDAQANPMHGGAVCATTVNDDSIKFDDGQFRNVLSFSGFSMATSFSEPVMLIDDAMFVLTVPEP